MKPNIERKTMWIFGALVVINVLLILMTVIPKS